MLPAILGGIGLLGQFFGGQAKAGADSRASQAEFGQRQDLLRNQQYGTAQNAQMQGGQLDLQRKQFSEEAPLNRAKQAALADILMNYSPQRVSVPGVRQANITGGTSLGEGGRAGIMEMQKQALSRLLAGEQGESFTGGQMLTPPSLSQIPKASGWEKLAGVLGIGGSLAGVLGQSGLFGDGGGQSYTQAKPMPEGLSRKPYDDLFTS